MLRRKTQDCQTQIFPVCSFPVVFSGFITLLKIFLTASFFDVDARTDGFRIRNMNWTELIGQKQILKTTKSAWIFLKRYFCLLVLFPIYLASGVYIICQLSSVLDYAFTFVLNYAITLLLLFFLFGLLHLFPVQSYSFHV